MKKGVLLLLSILVVGIIVYYRIITRKLWQQVHHAITMPAPADPLFESSSYFDTKQLLNDRQKTKVLLVQEGFCPVSFYTPDGIKLHGLFLQRPHSLGTVICIEGYHDGSRFDVAALTPIIPESYNILFFNQRGYTPSKGKSWKNLWFYGMHQHQDVIGAINFVNTLTHKPIILWGTCAGAFNAAHALIHLQQQNHTYSIKGLIFDSGWGSVPHTAQAFSKNIARKMVQAPQVSKPDTLVEKMLYGLILVSKKLLLIDYCWHVYHPQTTLHGKMKQLKLPILFIHAQNDHIASLNQVQQLLDETPHAFSWFVPESTHSMIHIKQKGQYRQVLTSFLNYASNL